MDSVFTIIGCVLVGLGALTAVFSALPLNDRWPSVSWPPALKAIGGAVVFEGLLAFLLALALLQRSVPFAWAAALIGLVAVIVVLLLVQKLQRVRGLPHRQRST